MKFKLSGERIIQYQQGRNDYATRTVTFVCEAEVQGVLVRMEEDKIHLRGVAGGRCHACGTKDTFPWMDVVSQKSAWEVHPDRCNYAYGG